MLMPIVPSEKSDSCQKKKTRVVRVCQSAFIFAPSFSSFFFFHYSVC